MCIAAYPGEGGGNRLALHDLNQQPAPGRQRTQRGYEDQPLARCEHLANDEKQPTEQQLAEAGEHLAEAGEQLAPRIHRLMLLSSAPSYRWSPARAVRLAG